MGKTGAVEDVYPLAKPVRPADEVVIPWRS
jgi:hypothetical protein